ncbi:protein FAR1-related sequence 5 [Tanacetum coccineum]
MDSSHSNVRSVVSHNFVSSDVAVGSYVPSGTDLNVFAEEIVAYENDKLNALCTPESFVTHSNFDTPCGTVYYISKVSANVLLVKRTVYDSVEDCVVAYMKYVAEAGFVVRRSCQKKMLNGDVKQKYLVCNRMGCPKGIHVDTLDLGNSDKQKRNSNLHITGCKARAVFNLDTCTRKFVLHVFDTIHNHELECEEYKHLCNKSSSPSNRYQGFLFACSREFGDVVSFDATFKTNKYKMVFVPFTAIDNHRKCVTVAAGLLKIESIYESFWEST